MARVTKRRKPLEPPATPLAAMLEKHLEDLRVRNYSEYTIKGRRVHIGFFLVWCHERGLTAMQLVRDGRAAEVMDYIDAVDAGLHA